MNIAVIGLGSMGKRRIRLLKKYIKLNKKEEKKWVILGIDLQKTRRVECNSLFDIEVYESIDEAMKTNTIDAVMISTSPLSHSRIIRKCLECNFHVFSEINLTTEGYDSNIQLAKEKGRILFLSSTLMYRKEIQYIQEWVNKIETPGMYRYHVGQYLPAWHPWESYMNFFVSNKCTNACREIFAIDLPWLIEVFGKVISIQTRHRKISQLDIDYDDSYHVIIEHESGTLGCFTVDVVTPMTERHFEYWQENKYISWGGHPDKLQVLDKQSQKTEKVILYNEIEHEEGYDQFIVENAYYEEIVEYIEAIEKGMTPRYSFEKDYEIIGLIDRIEM